MEVQGGLEGDLAKHGRVVAQKDHSCLCSEEVVSAEIQWTRIKFSMGFSSWGLTGYVPS